MSYKMKHVCCHFAKVISSFMNLATKNFEDTNVGLLSCTSQSCQASLPPRQKLQTNVLNAWIETHHAPSRFCSNGMTPAAHKLNYSRLPPPPTSHRRAQKWSDDKHPSQNRIAGFIAGRTRQRCRSCECSAFVLTNPIPRGLSRRKHASYLAEY